MGGDGSVEPAAGAADQAVPHAVLASRPVCETTRVAPVLVEVLRDVIGEASA